MKYSHFSLYIRHLSGQTCIQTNTQTDTQGALRACSPARISVCSRGVGLACTLPCVLTFTLACILAWTLTYSPVAHAQVTITSSQAREADKAKAPRFTPSQMGLRKETTHNQTPTTPTNQPHPATSAPSVTSATASETEAKGSGTASSNSVGPDTAGLNSQATGTTGFHSGPENQESLSAEEATPTPPNWSTPGANAVITITPSTALKSASHHPVNEGEDEEKSVTSWSSNATKAIIQYQEPTEPKPATGAPQLRPLN